MFSADRPRFATTVSMAFSRQLGEGDIVSYDAMTMTAKVKFAEPVTMVTVSVPLSGDTPPTRYTLQLYEMSFGVKGGEIEWLT